MLLRETAGRGGRYQLPSPAIKVAVAGRESLSNVAGTAVADTHVAVAHQFDTVIGARGTNLYLATAVANKLKAVEIIASAPAEIDRVARGAPTTSALPAPTAFPCFFLPKVTLLPVLQGSVGVRCE